jgi:5'-nucleotidase, C-terminal domain
MARHASTGQALEVSMRTLIVVLALAVLSGGGCLGPKDPVVEYLAAYDAFREAVRAAVVEGRPIPVYAAEVDDAATTFVRDLEAIPFPDLAKVDADALIEAVTILEQRCADASSGTDPGTMPASLLGVTEQVRMVRRAGARVAGDLGIAGDPGLAPVFSPTVGNASGPIPGSDACGATRGWTCESLIGDVVADALRGATGAEFALMNSGGIRADLTCPTIDSADDFCPPFTPPPHPITRGQVDGALPFGNIGMVATIDGATLKAMLENGVSQLPAPDFRFPQVSGLCFTYDVEAPAGARITDVARQAADGSCTGPVIGLTADASYTLATNNYVVAGGDGYPAVADVVMTGNVDQHVADWLSGAGTISPAIQGRIACTDPHPGSGNDCPTFVR